jgi:hypothetical protein
LPNTSGSDAVRLADRKTHDTERTHG